MHPSDAILLQRFRESRDQAAFQTLVDRYLPLVYSVALRVLNRSDLAEDVSQLTFVRLAEKAGSFRQDQGLLPWLHLTSRSLAIDLLRNEVRRKAREMKSASLMAPSSFPQPDWQSLSPIIDDLLSRLPTVDRSLILLRYYENRPLASVAASLGLSEAAARKRSGRALEKLRDLFQKRGIVTTASVLSALLPAHAVAAAPTGLAAAIGSSAFSTVPASGLLSFITMSTTTTTKLAAGIATVTAITAIAVTAIHHSAPDSENGAGASGSSNPATNPSSGSLGRHSSPSTRISTGELSRFTGILRLTDPDARREKLNEYLTSLSAADFAALVSHFPELGISPQSEEAADFYTAWAKLDPGSALISARFINPDLTGTLMGDWVRRDPTAAITWSGSQTDLDGNPNPVFLRMALPVLAESDPGRAMSLVDQLPIESDSAKFPGAVVPDSGRGGGLCAIMAAAVKDHAEQLQAMVSQIADPEIRQQATLAALQELTGMHLQVTGDHLAANISELGPEEQKVQYSAALAWYSANPELTGTQGRGDFFLAFAESDPKQATAALDKLPAGSELRKEGIGNVAAALAQNGDPAAGLALIDQSGEDMTADTLMRWKNFTDVKNPEMSLDNAWRFPDDGTREAVIGSTLQSWQRQDADAAADWLAQHPNDATRYSSWREKQK